jgi:hypothetical protein
VWIGTTRRKASRGQAQARVRGCLASTEVDGSAATLNLAGVVPQACHTGTHRRADIDSITLSLVGGGHLLFADRDPGPPPTSAINNLVTSAIADAIQRRPRPTPGN